MSAAGAQAEGGLDPEAFNWAALARATAHLFKHAPGLSCMLGPMDAAPKVLPIRLAPLLCALLAAPGLVAACSGPNTPRPGCAAWDHVTRAERAKRLADTERPSHCDSGFQPLCCARLPRQGWLHAAPAGDAGPSVSCEVSSCSAAAKTLLILQLSRTCVHRA